MSAGSVQVVLSVCLMAAAPATALTEDSQGSAPDARLDILSSEEWEGVRAAVDRGLAYLASTQQPDGSYPAYPTGNPAITSFCVLCFLSQGHLPGEGDYGLQMNRSIDYVLKCQKSDGLITKFPPRNDDIDPSRNPSHTAIYNHAISGLMLCEVYGMVDEGRSAKIRETVELAIQYTLKQQMMPKRLKEDIGGWRYVRRHPPEPADSDLSHTSWQLSFLRAAKNAGFDVPVDRIQLAVGYVKSRYSPEEKGFRYASRHRQPVLAATTGAGILSLSMSGQHNSEIAQTSASWLLSRPFRPYLNPQIERYHYAAFLCSMAMFQMGGRYWEEFYPTISQELVSGQLPDGSWQASNARHDQEARWGPAFTTSMAILALTAPDQLIPIYQR